MKKYNVNITAQSIYDLRDIIERDYEVETESRHEAEIASLRSFWKEIDGYIYSIVSQTCEEVTNEI
jgi:hypothetical protein